MNIQWISKNNQECMEILNRDHKYNKWYQGHIKLPKAGTLENLKQIFNQKKPLKSKKIFTSMSKNLIQTNLKKQFT